MVWVGIRSQDFFLLCWPPWASFCWHTEFWKNSQDFSNDLVLLFWLPWASICGARNSEKTPRFLQRFLFALLVSIGEPVGNMISRKYTTVFPTQILLFQLIIHCGFLYSAETRSQKFFMPCWHTRASILRHREFCKYTTYYHTEVDLQDSFQQKCHCCT